MARPDAIDDPEIVAIIAVKGALDLLDDDVRGNVLAWLDRRYRRPGSEHRPLAQGNRTDASSPIATPSRTLGEFIAGLSAETDGARVLAASAFFAEREGTSEFAASAINADLKHIGYGVANITRTIDRLIDQRPSLIVQVRKSGSSRQARKLYKITEAGLAEVERMKTEKA